MKSHWFNRITTFTIGWIISLLIWRIIRNFGINQYLDYLNINVSSLNILTSVIIISIFTGFIFGSVQYAYEKYFIKKISFRSLLINSLVIHVFIMLITYLSLYIILRIIGLDKNLKFVAFVTSPLTLTNLVYSIFVNSIIVIIIQINMLLGKGNLGKLITGKFHNPQEESRVFMFLDLKSSTTIAESLGHLKYSRFMQDCFFDLSVIESTNAEIYQYVGDEVVLTWKLNKGFSLTNCFKAFYLFKEKLQLRSAYYKSSYNHLPAFSAGMHLGLVTCVEVGSLKREIAYHGDTLNVASRIQGQCKLLKKDFLVSATVVDNYKNEDLFKFEEIESLVLRGKKESTLLFAVSNTY